MKWSNNVLRHSYGSYHLAKFEDINKTSLQLGHMKPDVLFNHYRDLVTREEADYFWNIFPVKTSNIIPLGLSS